MVARRARWRTEHGQQGQRRQAEGVGPAVQARVSSRSVSPTSKTTARIVMVAACAAQAKARASTGASGTQTCVSERAEAATHAWADAGGGSSGPVLPA